MIFKEVTRGSSILRALLSSAIPKRSNEAWALAHLLLICENIWVNWSGRGEKRGETSSVLLAAPAAAGGVERIEIVAAPICLEDRKVFITSHSRRLWFTQWFRLL